MAPGAGDTTAASNVVSARIRSGRPYLENRTLDGRKKSEIAGVAVPKVHGERYRDSLDVDIDGREVG